MLVTNFINFQLFNTFKNFINADTELFPNNYRTLTSSNQYDVYGLFAKPSTGLNSKIDGSSTFDSLIKNLQLLKSNDLNITLINTIVKDFHYMVQFIGQHSQKVLEEYSTALTKNDFEKALLILSHVYSPSCSDTYTLPLIFEYHKSFLVADLNINIIEHCNDEKKKIVLNDLINILLTSTSKINILECNNVVFKFPIANLLNNNNMTYESPVILLPSCLVDTSLLLKTTYYTDSILADSLESLGVSIDCIQKIKEMLISNNSTTIIIGKIAIVASTYEAILRYSKQQDIQYTNISSGILIERLYNCVIRPNNTVSQSDSAWINLMQRIWFGVLNNPGKDS